MRPIPRLDVNFYDVSGDTLARFWKTNPGTKGRIVSVSANRSVCYGVQDEGKAIHSDNDINREIFNRIILFLSHLKMGRNFIPRL